MLTTTATRMRLGMILACVLGVLAPMAAAQNQGITINDLRRENDALRQKLDQMSAQVDESTKKVNDLEARIRQLTAQVEALRAELASQGIEPRESSNGQPAPVSSVPMYATPSADEPYTSPDALFLAVRADYERVRTEQRWSAMEETRMRRMIADWAGGAGRKFRSKIEWLVDVSEVRDIPSGVVLTGNVIAPDTGYAYGDMGVIIELSGALARKVKDNPKTEVWRIVGNVSAAPRMNPERETMGFFNVPAFVGPHAEFLFDVRATGLVPAARPEDANQDDQQR